MRNPDRIENFCDDFSMAWSRVPDWRFGQFISNCFLSMKNDGLDPFYLEEDEMINYINKYLDNILGCENKMKFRKKPIIIEAYQTDKELDIPTLEGTMHASIGDWIITGAHGEQYPCKPDIFEETYERVEEE